MLIGRAGAAVARAAVRMLGGTYGRRVVVVAGKGNNGADGRDAARRLERRGVRVDVIDAADAPDRLPACDLVDRRRLRHRLPRRVPTRPIPAGAPVLAVDIPSGVDGLTGEAGRRAVRADAHGHLRRPQARACCSPPGRRSPARSTVADIGLDVSARHDPPGRGGRRRRLAPVPAASTPTSGRPAVWVVAGSPGMTGAATLAARGAQRGRRGLRAALACPGVDDRSARSGRGRRHAAAGRRAGPAMVLDDADRFRALVVGPGPGRADARGRASGRLVGGRAGPGRRRRRRAHRPRRATPASLRGPARPRSSRPTTGSSSGSPATPPGPDRIAAARDLAARTGAVVLLKGPTTVVADADGRVLADDHRATPGWPPPAPATCWPASSARCCAQGARPAPGGGRGRLRPRPGRA